jgi:hypothetical protein
MNAQGALHKDYPTQSKNLGDHRHHTTTAIDLSYLDVDVPDPTPELPDGGAIYWTLVLTNSADPGAVTDAEKIVIGLLQALADKQIGAATNLASLIANIGLIEIAPELTGHGLPLSKCEAYNRVYDQFYRSR